MPWLKRITCISLLLFPTTAFAHAFGQQFTLPLPVLLYIGGGVAALVASFVIFGFFGVPGESTKENRNGKIFRLPWLKYPVAALKILFLLLFVLTIATGIWGSDYPSQNPTPTLFWIILLLGFSYSTIFVDGIWERVNPVKTLVQWIVGPENRGFITYPARLAHAPALAIYFFLIWAELLFGAGADPHLIGAALLVYFLISLFGAVVFGVADWFEYVDFFGVFFRVLGKCAAIVIGDDTVTLTRPGNRLIREKMPSFALLAFVLFMLASTSFDGFKDTSAWAKILYSSAFTLNHTLLATYGALLLSPIAFFILYALAIGLMRQITRAGLTFWELLLRYGYSLVPIALAYHFAHYFMLLFINGQFVIPMLSDPFGKKWNILGAAGFTPNIAIIGADTVWHIQLGVIVGAHIVATYIAHRIAIETFPSRRSALISQIPMLLLMVAYTAFGLWLLSRPFSSAF